MPGHTGKVACVAVSTESESFGATHDTRTELQADQAVEGRLMSALGVNGYIFGAEVSRPVRIIGEGGTHTVQPVGTTAEHEATDGSFSATGAE